MFSDRGKRRTFGFWGVAALVAALATGCAAAPAVPIPQKGSAIFGTEASGESVGWRSARFKWQWPDGEQPRWHLDCLAAHRIVGPILEEFQSELPLWRFHRRSARDASGHRFSFMFYGSAKTAEAVFRRLRDSPVLPGLFESGLLEKIHFDEIDPSAPKNPRIGDTGDPSWPEAVRRAWPHYIMGVSRMWLELVDQAIGEQGGPWGDSSPEKLSDSYREANEAVAGIWRDHGYHAFLHHLNAVFGYRPLMVLERRMMKF